MQSEIQYWAWVVAEMSSPLWPWLAALAEERRGRNLGLLHLLSLSRPLQTGGRRQFVLEIGKFMVQYFMAGKVLENEQPKPHVLQSNPGSSTIAEVFFSSKMAVLPGQAPNFMAPYGTENGWIWIQLIKMTETLCCQLFS